MSSLGLITSNYGYLNGLSGCGSYGYGSYGGYGYGGGIYGTANAEQAKENIANNYDIYATSQSYKSKQGVESVNYDQQCALLYSDLKAGEADQASERFEGMVKQMKNSAQYANYSDDEIRALIRNNYTTATGSDLISDIKKGTSGDYIQGLKRCVPVFGLLAQENSESDLVAQVTGSAKTTGEKFRKTAGMVTGATLGAGGLYTLGSVTIKSAKGGALGGILSKIPKSKGTKLGLTIAGIAGGIALLTSIFGGNDKKETTSV